MAARFAFEWKVIAKAQPTSRRAVVTSPGVGEVLTTWRQQSNPFAVFFELNHLAATAGAVVRQWFAA